MTYMTIAVMGALCLVFASTRKYALLCIALLLYLYPYPTLALLAAAVPATFYFLKWRKTWTMKSTSLTPWKW